MAIPSVAMPTARGPTAKELLLSLTTTLMLRPAVDATKTRGQRAIAGDRCTYQWPWHFVPAEGKHWH